MICVPDGIERDEFGWTLHWPCMESEHTVLDPCEAMRVHLCPTEQNRADFAFGEAVRSRRLALGWTQAQLGMRVGMWQPAISQVEQGHLHVDEAKASAITEALRFERPLPGTPRLVEVAGSGGLKEQARHAPPLPTNRPRVAALGVTGRLMPVSEQHNQ